MKRNKKRVIQGLQQKQDIYWPTLLLRLALREPFKDIGIRFWDLKSKLFLCFSSEEINDEDGIIKKGWSLCDEKRNISRSIHRTTAKLILSGLIVDTVEKTKKDNIEKLQKVAEIAKKLQEEGKVCVK